ncbi:MAG TPA: GNAT family N-acetyltransferase [Pyrinomonadaceae bacterium]|jgi:RimJ/RimL family protein N-acetyltransferase
MPITFRPIGPDDEAFLRELYDSTRTDEMAAVPWNEAQKEAFLRMQFQAQHDHYQIHYPKASYEIILSDERPVGRLYVARQDEKILIIDMTLLPAARNKGIGTPIIKDLMAESAKTGKGLEIYVESFNPSLRLFQRLGFSKIGEEGVYLLMEWNGERSA